VRLLCAGHVNWDVTLEVDRLPGPDGEARITDESQSGGGSAANTASVCSTLDVPAGILGSVGTDQHGYQARRELVDAGVDTGHLVETAVGTAVKYLVVDPDGRVMVLGDDRGNEAFDADDVAPDLLAALDHLHLTSQRPATATELATLAREHDTTVSFDPGRRVTDRDYGTAIERSNYLFLTEREAEAALELDLSDPDDRPDDRVVVLKAGTDGASVRTPDRTCTHGGFDVDPVDTTGAGDAFAAGFLTALLTGWDPDEDATNREATASGATPDFELALRLANACGAIATRQTGARVRITRGDLRRFLEAR